jgi:hypothetical protein
MTILERNQKGVFISLSLFRTNQLKNKYLKTFEDKSNGRYTTTK